MSRPRRPARGRGRATAFASAAAAASLLLAACDGALTDPAARGGSASLALAITLQAEAGGGEGDAYDAADVIHIQVTGSGTVLLEQVATFEPSAETRVPISVRIEQETTVELQVTLLRGTSPLFVGATTLTLVPNDIASAELALVPVPASIDVPEALPPLRSQGETAVLAGSVLFATGDVATSLHLQWVSLTPDIVTVQSDGSISSVVAVRSGSGRLKAAFPPFQRDVRVDVDIVAARVDVEPSPATVGIGETLALTAIPRDALGNPVEGTHATWSSLDETVATVGETGVVRGVARGTTTIRATVDAATGETSLEVVAPRPTVGTEPASRVRVFGATLNATVSARGSPATAWFRYGTDPTLATASETPAVDIGSGEEEQSFSTEVDGLDPDTEYFFRAVAENDGGERQGDIVAFTTLTLSPPAAVTLDPSPVTSTTARLHANVAPRGATTTVSFEWGTDPTLAKATTTSAQVIDGAEPETAVEHTVTGLKAGGNYYARVVATNAAGTTRGDIVAFVTPPPPPSSLVVYYDSDFSYVRMYWASGGGATAIRVERSVLSATASFTPIQTLPGGATTAYEASPFAAKTLWYRVRACIGTSCSEPSSAETITVPDAAVFGTLYICYTPGTTIDCFSGSGGINVVLDGDASKTTKTSTFGTYVFSGLASGSYTVRIDDESCYFAVRDPNEKPVAAGWGESKQLDFYADIIYCGAPPRAPSGR